MEKSAHKAGFVNIIGNPNVGKSTLMNAFVGEKLSIITNKSQTTRHRILGIVNGDDFQMVLSDTPGIIKPAYELQNSMMDFVKSAFQDADVLIYMVELGEKALKDEEFFKKLQPTNIPILL
ncbi:MAG: GTPase, partial [Psychroflexus sp.]